MSEKDSAHSVIVNIPRFRTFAKFSTSDIKKYNKQKECDKVIKKLSDTTLCIYTMPINKPLLRINAFKNDTLLLSVKLYAKHQEINKRKQCAAIKLHQRYKIINTDLQNRLHVENPPNDVQGKKDIDENYFRSLNSHTTFQYIPQYKSLKFEYHERLRMRQEIGYKQDYILNITENWRREQSTYEQSVKSNMNQIKQFDEFIAYDYQRSMIILKQCEELVAQLNEKISIRGNLAHQQFTIQSRLIGLDYMYFVQQKYGRFLYYLSPPNWRVKHRKFARSIEIEAKGFDLGTSSEEDTFNVIFQKMKKECSDDLVKPVLYFADPSELMAMFERMEKQYSDHFRHVVFLSSYAVSLNKNIEKLKRSIQQDTAFVAQSIEAFVQLVNFCEQREAQLQAKFMQILYGLFYDSVAAPDVLKLKFNLEFYYEKIYREESLNRNYLSTARALENMYMDYLFKLDALTNESLKKAMKRCLEREANKMKQAQIAARELRSFATLEQALLKAFKKRNPYVATSSSARRPLNPKLKRQSVKPTVRASSQHHSFTEDEIEYLRLFTDWTDNEDPAKYFQSVEHRQDFC